jgi:hypothetical protein
MSTKGNMSSTLESQVINRQRNRRPHPHVFRFQETNIGKNELFVIVINLLGILLGITNIQK